MAAWSTASPRDGAQVITVDVCSLIADASAAVAAACWFMLVVTSCVTSRHTCFVARKSYNTNNVVWSCSNPDKLRCVASPPVVHAARVGCTIVLHSMLLPVACSSFSRFIFLRSVSLFIHVIFGFLSFWFLIQSPELRLFRSSYASRVTTCPNTVAFYLITDFLTLRFSQQPVVCCLWYSERLSANETLDASVYIPHCLGMNGIYTTNLCIVHTSLWRSSDGRPCLGSVPSAGHLSRYVTSHPGQLSLAIHSWVGTMSTSQRAVTPCCWRVKAGMVRVCVAGKTVWSTCYTRDISERFGDRCRALKALYKSIFFTFHNFTMTVF